MKKMNGISEVGWLIEAKPSVHRTPHWLGFNGEIEDLDSTPDSLKAIRFARQQDAEAFIGYIGWTEVFASNHRWGAGPTSAVDRLFPPKEAING